MSKCQLRTPEDGQRIQFLQHSNSQPVNTFCAFREGFVSYSHSGTVTNTQTVPRLFSPAIGLGPCCLGYRWVSKSGIMVLTAPPFSRVHGEKDG